MGTRRLILNPNYRQGSSNDNMCRADREARNTLIEVNLNSNSGGGCPVTINSRPRTPSSGSGAVPPGVGGENPLYVFSTNVTASTGTPSNEPETSTFIQEVSNTSFVRPYFLIYYDDYSDDAANPTPKKGILASKYVHEISCSRSVLFANQTMTATVSLHEKYKIYELNQKDFKYHDFIEVFKVGNIIDFAVETYVTYRNNDGNTKKNTVEKKYFLLQRGALTGYTATRTGDGAATISLFMETIDKYAQRTKMFISVHNEKIINQLQSEKAKDAKKAQKKEGVKKLKESSKSNDTGVPTNSTERYINDIVSLLTNIQNLGIAGTGDTSKEQKKRGVRGLYALFGLVSAGFSSGEEYTGVASSITVNSNRTYRKYYNGDKSAVIMNYRVEVLTNNVNRYFLANTLIGVLGHADDYLFSSRYGAGNQIFKDVIDMIKSGLNRDEVTYAEIFSKLGMGAFHEVYYDPFLELEAPDKPGTHAFITAKNSIHNKVFMNTDENGALWRYKNIRFPSFVLRHKPILAIFDLDKKGVVTKGSSSKLKASHIYDIPLESIMSINVVLQADNLKTGVVFGEAKNIIPPDQFKDVISFGSNILSIDRQGYLPNIDNLIKSELYTTFVAAACGIKGHFVEATITCIYSPMRAGTMFRIETYDLKEKETIVDEKKVTKFDKEDVGYVYGYIQSVRENFSANGDATVTIEATYLSMEDGLRLMGINADGRKLRSPAKIKTNEFTQEANESPDDTAHNYKVGGGSPSA